MEYCHSNYKPQQAKKNKIKVGESPQKPQKQETEEIEENLRKEIDQVRMIDTLTDKMLHHCMGKNQYEKYKNSIIKKDLQAEDFKFKDKKKVELIL